MLACDGRLSSGCARMTWHFMMPVCSFLLQRRRQSCLSIMTHQCVMFVASTKGIAGVQIQFHRADSDKVKIGCLMMPICFIQNFLKHSAASGECSDFRVCEQGNHTEMSIPPSFIGSMTPSRNNLPKTNEARTWPMSTFCAFLAADKRQQSPKLQVLFCTLSKWLVGSKPFRFLFHSRESFGKLRIVNVKSCGLDIDEFVNVFCTRCFQC
jgi:hypothetical protein